MQAFITGGAGFIGSSMTGRLLLGPQNSVTIFDNFTWGNSHLLRQEFDNPRIRIVEADLLDLTAVIKAIEGHDAVYHFASNADISRGMEDTSLDLKQSILATYNLLEAMRLTGVGRITFMSGSGIYGDVGQTETGEDFGPLLPISMYGAGKLGAEALISAFCHMYGIKSYILRLANVVGPRQTHGVVLDFISRLSANPHKLMILGDGSQSKSYIHIDDVLDAAFFLEAMSDEQINLFNIATDDAVDVNWIARTVMEAMNLSGVEVEYTGGNRGWPGDVPVVRLNVSRIRQLGFRPKLNSQQAIRQSTQELLARLQRVESVKEDP